MKIKELFANPLAWTQGSVAKDAAGMPISRLVPWRRTSWELVNYPQATCFCLIGAVIKCYGEGEDKYAVMEKIGERIGPYNIATWNDDPRRTHTDVLKLVTELDV